MRSSALSILFLVALAASGCGSQDETTPVACLQGTGAYTAALAAAPGEALLDDEAAISECLAENQAGGQLATVGAAMLELATRLNSQARSAPGGRSALELGYLLGAAHRGAAQTSGIHTELVRRLDAAARYSPADRALPAAFLRAYRRGFDAGRERG